MKKLLPFSVMLALVITAQAQNVQYQLSAFTTPFAELSGATVHDEADWDDPFITIPLEFPFQLGNTVLTSLSQVGLGAEWGEFNFSAFSFSSVGYYPDLISSAEANNPGAPSIISWLTDGPAGNRILKIEYKDAAFYSEVMGDETAENRVTFQLWFYEAGSAIEFRFGPSNITDPFLAYEGFEGPPLMLAANVDLSMTSTGAVDVGLLISGNPSNPQLITFDNYFDFEDQLFDGEISTLSGTPANGQVYRLDQLIVSTNDEEAPGFLLYPTIAEQEIRIKGQLSSVQNFRIVNITGAAVKNGVLNNNRIDVSDLAPGVYLMQLDGYHTAQKFVKR